MCHPLEIKSIIIIIIIIIISQALSELIFSIVFLLFLTLAYILYFQCEIEDIVSELRRQRQGMIQTRVRLT